ncbi:hypothetical protein GPAL_0613 [Glaciecola pallidula DSM 14239 = ACAM 615]|uniref:Uncharacterized protein n=1 Tax=Brumicola pallidula DSM 14239 = ACAM 615 TaxID=1121922 RepID=K6ZEZ0_9ALTE|nr:hypothetical protein GPAL_0613 [Glaciecola pallidula DSM 14239 = ACAM 615]
MVKKLALFLQNSFQSAKQGVNSDHTYTDNKPIAEKLENASCKHRSNLI